MTCMDYQLRSIGPPPPPPRRNAELYRALEALPPDAWQEVACADREAARQLGIAAQARYRHSRAAGRSVRCETRMDRDRPGVIWMRLVPREEAL